MRRSKKTYPLLLALIILASCSREDKPDVTENIYYMEEIPVIRSGRASQDEFSIPLDGIAEVERSGVYYPGLGFTESGLREKAGDYAGAVFAAYRELSYSYGYGEAAKKEVESALNQTLSLFENSGPPEKIDQKAALAAISGVKAFHAESWDEAACFLHELKDEDEAPDSFLSWMLLVCSLENDEIPASSLKAARSAYGAIRARYNSFPEYWYRGARAYTKANSENSSVLAGVPAGQNIAGIYAEQCINLSSAGPFSSECRNIIAEGLGIAGAGYAIKSKTEIDDTIRRSVSAENPALLESLLPLITLPDNSYTAYTVEIFKNLVSFPSFRSYFEKEAAGAQGRLAERLRYISRG